MKQFVCDKCFVKVDDSNDLSTFCFTVVEFHCSDWDKTKHDHKDLCSKCRDEIEDIIQQAKYSSKKKLLEWFDTKPKHEKD